MVEQAAGIADPPSLRREVENALGTIGLARIHAQAPAGNHGAEPADVAAGASRCAPFSTWRGVNTAAAEVTSSSLKREAPGRWRFRKAAESRSASTAQQLEDIVVGIDAPFVWP